MAIDKLAVEIDLETQNAEQKYKRLIAEFNAKGKEIKKLQIQIDKTDINKIKSDLENLNSQINRIKGNKFSLEADVSKLNKLREELDETKKMIVELQRQKLDLEVSGASSKEIREVDLALKDLRVHKGEINVQIDGLKQSEKDLKYFYDLLKQRADLEIQIKNYEGSKEKLEQLKTEYSELDGQIIEVREQLVGDGQVKSSLERLKETITEINNRRINITAVGQGIEDVGRKMNNIFSINGNSPIGRFMSFFIKGIGYSAIYRNVTAFQSGITTAFSEGIKRYDMINVSKRTLATVLADTQDATRKIQKAIDSLDKSIEGLPTTLNDAMSAVTKFTSINHDIDRSQKLFSAMNDAILTFGGTQDQVNNAVTQYSQIMGSKMDARTFRSLEEAQMTPALTAVAKKMGMTFTEFRNAFTGQNPTISLQQFEDALIELDEKGGGGLASLSSMAKKSAETISNAFKLMQVRANKAMTNIISSVDNLVKNVTGKNIYENVYGFTESMMKKSEEISKWIDQNPDKIMNVINGIKDAFHGLAEEARTWNMKDILKGISDAKPVLNGILDMLKFAYNIFKGMTSFIGGGNQSRGLGRLIAGWYLMSKGLIVLGKAIKFFAPSIAILAQLGKISKTGTLFKGFKGLGNMKKAIENPFGSGSDTGKKATDVFNVDSFKNMLSKHLDKGLYLAELAGLAGDMILFAKAIKELDNSMPDNIGDLLTDIGMLGTVVVSMEGLAVLVGKISENLKGADFTGIVAMIAEGGTLWMFAKAIQEFNKALKGVTFTDVITRLSALAEVVVGFGAIATAVGFGISAFQPLTLLSSIGFIGLIAEGGTLWLLAKSVQALNKLPSNYKGISKKVNALMDTVNDIMYAMTEHKTLNSVPVIGPAINALDNFAKGLSGFTKAFENKGIASSIKSIGKIFDSIESISKVKKFNKDKIKSNINNVASIIKFMYTDDSIKWIRDNSMPETGGGKDKGNNTLLNDADNLSNNFSQISKIFKSISKSGDYLKNIQNFSFDPNVIVQKVQQLRDIISAFTERASTDTGKKDSSSLVYQVGKLKGKIKILKQLGDIFNSISTALSSISTIGNTDYKLDDSVIQSINTKIGYIKSIVSEITKEDFVKILSKKKIPSASKFGNLNDIISQFTNILNGLNTFNTTWNNMQSTSFNGQDMVGNIKGTINGFNDIMSAFTENDVKDGKQVKGSNLVANINKIGKQQQAFSQLGTMVQGMVSAVQQLDSLTGLLSSDKVTAYQTTLSNFRMVIKTITAGGKDSLVKDVSSIGKQSEAFSALPNALTNMLNSINIINQMYATLSNIDLEAVRDKIIEARDIVFKLFSANGSNDGDLASTVANVNKVNFSGLLTKIQQYSSAINTLNSLAPVDTAKISSITEQVKTSINSIAESTKGAKGNKAVAQVKQLVDSFKQVRDELMSVASAFYDVGNESANAISKGFKEFGLGNVLTTSVTDVASLITKNASGAYRSLGTTLGNKFVSGFKSGIKNISLSSLTKSLNNGSAFYNTGVSLGKQLLAGIRAGAKGNVTVHATVSTHKSTGGAVGDAIGSVIGNISSMFSHVFHHSNGGNVAYRAKGGLAYFEPKGTDVVPAMLTPGEYVIKRSAVSKYGGKFFDHLNNMDLDGALNRIKTRYNNPSQSIIKNYSIVNNNTINKYDNRSVTINGDARKAETKTKVGRWMRALS